MKKKNCVAGNDQVAHRVGFVLSAWFVDEVLDKQKPGPRLQQRPMPQKMNRGVYLLSLLVVLRHRVDMMDDLPHQFLIEIYKKDTVY